MKRLTHKGFTIIELLIATVVFSVILLVVTGAIVQFSRVYYKGVIQARTQERARAILEDISQNMQFAGSSATSLGNYQADPGQICAGSRVYTFKLNTKVAANQHALVAQNGLDCGTNADMTSPFPTGSSATELLGEKMEILSLTADPIGTDLVIISVKLAYGESTDRDGDVCKVVRLGGQFCAVTEQSTIVSRRFK